MPEKEIEHINEQAAPRSETEMTERDILYSTRSEEVQDIMGKIPSWLTRWGITLMTMIVLGVLAGACLFKYPDVIPAKITISSSNPPVKLVARNSLPIQNLMVKNNENVKENQILCILSNPANYPDVVKVVNLITTLDTVKHLKEFCLEAELPQTLNLGELQSEYVALYQSIAGYRFFLKHNSYGDKMLHLTEQSLYQKKLSDELLKKDTHLKEQLTIQSGRFKMDSSLVAQTVMSRQEYENERKDLLNQQMSTEGNYSTILQSRVQEKEIQENIAETAIQAQTEENNFQEKIREAAKQFKGAWSQWEQNYVLRSPVAGKVSFFKFWKANQYVLAGETVMMVTPPLQKYIARGEIGLSGAGKIKPGQKVLIHLSAYPYEEFGSLSASVSSRSFVAIDSAFSVEIALEQGLHTNINKNIPPQPQLEGTAEIITEDKSYLERLFENIYGKNKR